MSSSETPYSLESFVYQNIIETVVTFASPKENEDNDGELSEQGDLRRAMYKDAIGIHGRRCDDCFDFAALTVFHAVRALLDGTTDTNLQVFRIFEEYISILVSTAVPALPPFLEVYLPFLKPD